MASHDKSDPTDDADYDDAVLDSGWMPQPDAVSPEPPSHHPRPSDVARDDADVFLDIVYRSQGSID